MIVVIIIIIIDHRDDLGVVKIIIVVVIIIITMPLMDSSSSAAAATACQDIDGWWRGFFILFLNYMNWIRETYSNDPAFIMLVIVSYCGQQIYFTYKHATTICS